MQSDYPILSTSRLTMTPFDVSDFNDCLAMRSDPEVTRFVGGPVGREDVWFRVLRYIGHWQALGFGCWAVRETSTGRFVGEIGFFDYRREIEPDFAGTPEGGWVTDRWAHGKGFASEAITAMLAWGDRRPDFSRTMAIINPGNVPSLRTAEKCGYRRLCDTRYKTHPIVLFERSRPIAQ